MKKITYLLLTSLFALTSCQQGDEIFETAVKKDANKEKVDICHKGRTINIDILSIEDHLNHGDVLGECTDEPDVNYTFVPDDNFEQALIDFGYDDLLDNLVLTSNISLVEKLNIRFREIVDLTGIEDFENLYHLNCSNNNISYLDLSNNTLLERLFCRKNGMLYLNVKNGTNTIITDFDVRFNYNLECIQVDDATYSLANWPLKDVTASYSEDCGY